MKKSLIFILILFLFPIISAIEFDIKTEFDQQETLIAKVSGNFLEPITKDNIVFYRGHVRIPIDYGVVEIQEEFYIYAQLSGKTPNNYSIALEDITYTVLGRQSQENIIKNFSITNNTADFSVNPGAIFTEEDFSIEVENWQDSEIEISINIDGEESGEGFFASLLGSTSAENSTIVKSGQKETINFKLKNITQPRSKTIKLSTDNLEYEIPVYVYSAQTPEEQESYQFEPDADLEINMATNTNRTKKIYLFNTGDEILEDISISLSESLEQYVSLSIDEIEKVDPNEPVEINLEIIAGEEAGIITGEIKAKTSKDLYIYLPVTLNLVKDYVLTEEDKKETINPSKNCSELNGTICEQNQECDVPEQYARDNKCCTGTCKDKEKPGPWGKIIGWLIVIAIIAGAIWFFKAKYRKASSPIDLFEVAKGKN